MAGVPEGTAVPEPLRDLLSRLARGWEGLCTEDLLGAPWRLMA